MCLSTMFYLKGSGWTNILHTTPLGPLGNDASVVYSPKSSLSVSFPVQPHVLELIPDPLLGWYSFYSHSQRKGQPLLTLSHTRVSFLACVLAVSYGFSLCVLLSWNISIGNQRQGLDIHPTHARAGTQPQKLSYLCELLRSFGFHSSRRVT